MEEIKFASASLRPEGRNGTSRSIGRGEIPRSGYFYCRRPL